MPPPVFLPTGPRGAHHGFAPSGFLEPLPKEGNGRGRWASDRWPRAGSSRQGKRQGAVTGTRLHRERTNSQLTELL